MAHPLTTPREALLAFAQNLDDWADEAARSDAPFERWQALHDAATAARDWADDQRCEVPILTRNGDELLWRPGIAPKAGRALLEISAVVLECEVDDLVIGRRGLARSPASLPVCTLVGAPGPGGVTSTSAPHPGRAPISSTPGDAGGGAA